MSIEEIRARRIGDQQLSLPDTQAGKAEVDQYVTGLIKSVRLIRPDFVELFAALDAMTAERDAAQARVKELEAAIGRLRTQEWPLAAMRTKFIATRRCPFCHAWMVKETPPDKPWVCGMCGWTDKEAKPDAD